MDASTFPDSLGEVEPLLRHLKQPALNSVDPAWDASLMHSAAFLEYPSLASIAVPVRTRSGHRYIDAVSSIGGMSLFARPAREDARLAA